MKLDNLRLLVTDYPQMFLFYRDVLQLPLTWGSIEGNFASFAESPDSSKSSLALFKQNLMPEEVCNQPSASGDSKVAIVLQVDSVDESYLALQKKGCCFLTLPKDMADWGIRVAHLQDPEGNLLEIFSYLPKEKWSEQLLSQTPAS